MQKKIVHVIPHTHWDREWYFTASRSTVYLIKHIKELLDILETDLEYQYYLLDGQTSLLEDYLTYYPEDEERIKKLITDKRLLTGPWYTQTDQLVVSQESLVRNLYYGTSKAQSLGHCMRVGYVPDVFGQGGNMPQIYHDFNIDNVLFWRGLSDTSGIYTEINWQGNDGTEVFAVQMPQGYCTSGFMPEDPEQGNTYWNQQLRVLEERASTSHLYASWGFDQAPVRKNLPQLLEEANRYDQKRQYVLDSPENFFAAIKDEVDFKKLQTITGELTQGKHSRVHKSIFSTRADLKGINNQIENYLVNTLEPILTLSYSFGNRYPHREIEEIWKLLFQNAAHDSIGGCNSDSTNEDIKQRYKLAKEKAENLAELNMRLITQKITHEQPIIFTVFNPLTYKTDKTVTFNAYVPSHEFTLVDENQQIATYTITSSKDVTSYVLGQVTRLNMAKDIYVPKKVYQVTLKVRFKDIPALGYKTIELKEGKPEGFGKETVIQENFIENGQYKISLEKDLSVTIINKVTGKVYQNQMIFEENGDDGDSYNYSPPKEDLVISSQEAGELISCEAVRSDIEETLRIKLKMAVPKDLSNRAAKKRNGEMTILAEISLRDTDHLIDFRVAVENNVLSHRLCVLFDTEISSQFSTADQMFGTVRRPVARPELAVWEAEKWEEIPVSIEPMQSYVALHDEAGGCAVITEGVREYEIIGEEYSVIRLTLFRTFGYMGKADLLYRPGRASGDDIVATPDAQLLGTISTQFSLYCFDGISFDEADVAKAAKERLTTYPVYETADFLNNRMRYVYRDEEKEYPQSFSLLDLSQMNSIVSTIKKAEHDSRIMIRIYNPYLEHPSTVAKVLINNGKGVSLDEETQRPLKAELTKCQFETISISL